MTTLVHALARLAAAPMFTIFSVVSLGAGVAVTTAVYSIVDSLFAGDLGVDDSDRLGLLSTANDRQGKAGSISVADFADLRAVQRSFASISATAALTSSVASTASAEVANAEAVDGSYFATLAVRVSRGRAIEPHDDAAAGRVAVISNDFWRDRYAADSNVVGRTIRINGRPFEVIGVLPPHYHGLFGVFRRTRVWIPLATEQAISTRLVPSGAQLRERGRLVVFGRLAADRSIFD